MRRSTGNPLAATELATSTAVNIDLQGVDRLAVQVVYSDVDPDASAVDAEDVDENSFSDAGHGFVTGLKGQMTTSDADLPDGLSTTTDYYVIVIDEDTYQLASSLDNAAAGTAIDLADAGTGTHTFTPTESAGNVAKLQESVDGENWADVGGHTVTIATSAGSALWNVGEVHTRYMRVLYTPSAGQVSLAVHASYAS